MPQDCHDIPRGRVRPMPARHVLYRALLWLLLALPAAAPAAGSYQVEVVIFRQWEAGGADAELSPTEPPPPQAVRPVTLGEAGFLRLTPAQLELTGVQQRLAQSESYRVLAHFGWEQPALSPGRSRSVVIPSGWRPGTGAPPDSELFGTLRLMQRNRPHLHADLRYRSEGSDTLYTMIQQQRLPKARLYYFDHPVLGMVVELRPTTDD